MLAHVVIQSQVLAHDAIQSQMLAHVQVPMGVALGTHIVKGNWLMKLILPLFKKNLYDEKPWKQGLPTSKEYKIVDSKVFLEEKNNLIELINEFHSKKSQTN